MQTLSELFSTAASDTVMIPTTWGQGRATLGGLVAALLYARLESVIATQNNMLRSASISFVAPVVADAEATIQHQIFREGKSVIQAQSSLIQNGEVKATMLASFGAKRESAIAVATVNPPAFVKEKPPEAVPYFPYMAGVMPEFLQHIETRVAVGSMPYSGAKTPDFAGYMRFNEQLRSAWKDDAFGVAHLITLADTWPPSVIALFKKPDPASTLNWTFELIKPITTETMQTLWRFEVTTDIAQDGYVHNRANIWNEAGELVAISRQTDTVFA